MRDVFDELKALIDYVHIGFSQQQPKQQQRVPALQRAGRLSVCG